MLKKLTSFLFLVLLYPQNSVKKTLKTLDFYFTVTFPFLGLNNNKRTGNSTRFVTVAVINVTEVSHPKAKVPPKLLAQKMTNPAVSTNEVYIILSPVC